VGDDPLAPIDRRALEKLVTEKTPFTMGEFERICGWDFLRDAPASKKKLAWDILNLGRPALARLHEAYRAFPKLSVTGVRDGYSPLSDDVGAARSDG